MQSLKKVYENLFLIGNIYTPRMLENEPLKKMMSEQFSAITAENIMKPMLIQPSLDNFIWDAADNMMEFAEKYDFDVIGHTLAWHQQTLHWIDEENTTREEAIVLLRNHLSQILTRYNGKIKAWDVLNEAFEDGVQEDTKQWRKHLRNTPWLRMIGEDYIEIVFKMARELDPFAKLYYNDYNLNYHQKREATYYMVKELRDSGVPIDGIGLQGHYHTNTPISTVEESFKLFSTIDGIELSVTELDVTVTGSENGSFLSLNHEIEQAQYYAQLFIIYKKYVDFIKRITFWGTDDLTSWRGERFPTIFNYDYSPKLSFDAIIDPTTFLQNYPLVERDTTQTAIATKGTPDLENDSTWNKENSIAINRQLTAWEGATATANIMWDDANLYFSIDVKDNTLQKDDSVEIYLSLDNSKEDAYGLNDYHITITSDNVVNFNGRSTCNLTTRTYKKDDGYTIQAHLPFDDLVAGKILGLDLQVNDINNRGERQSSATWNNFIGGLEHSKASFGNLLLFE